MDGAVPRDARVGVLMGGLSAERDVSLASGRAVAAALGRRGWDVVEVDVGTDLPERLRAAGVEVAWIALHGQFGEDGCVQGLLEVMRIPYTGSGPAASAISMDKHATKQILRGHGLHLPPHHLWRRGEPLPPELGYPLFAKTPCGGSTIGTFRCAGPEDLDAALASCLQHDDRVLLEQGVAGDEITVAILDGQPLPVVAIRPLEGFFDFDAKYHKGRTRYVVPADVPEAAARSAQEQARIAAGVLGLSGVARADFIVDPTGVPWFLEVNTIPGMTETSLSPMAAAAVGMSFDDLVEAVLRSARLHLQVARTSPAG